MMLSECIEEYMDDCYALAGSTQSLYRYHLERLAHDVGDLPMEEITSSVARRFMANLRRQDGEEYSPHYQAQVYRTLNTFFRWCVREGTLILNPMDKVRRPRVPKRKSSRLLVEQIDRLLEAVQQTKHAMRNLAMVCLMLDSGLRRGEVLELKVTDIDLEAGVVRAFGKDKEEREVPLSKITCQVLQTYLEARPVCACKALFVIAKGTALTRNGLQSFMYRLKGQAAIPELHCHLLRHTFANYYIRGGGGLRKLQKILGHNDVSTTADLYTDPELEELQEEHARVSPLTQINAKRDSN